MAWIEYTATTFAQRISGPELSALKNAARGTGQTGDSLVAECVTRVIEEIRGHVSGCTRNVLGPEGYIPSELEDAACALTVYRFITRLPNQTTLLDDRRVTAYRDALALLERVSACKFGIVGPETPAENQAGGGGVTLVASRPNIQTREQTRFIL